MQLLDVISDDARDVPGAILTDRKWSVRLHPGNSPSPSRSTNFVGRRFAYFGAEKHTATTGTSSHACPTMAPV